MTYLHAIVLGLVQGATEFLPVSSSGHLIVVPWLFGWPYQGLAFDASIHLGTGLALLIYFVESSGVSRPGSWRAGRRIAAWPRPSCWDPSPRDSQASCSSTRSRAGSGP